ncbi:hypothetical protein ACFL96_13190 [Thermoproteota archaeon]
MADIVAQLKQQFTDIAKKIGLIKSTGPKPAAGAKPAAGKPGAQAIPKAAKPKFDFNLFIKATQDFWKSFLEVKVPAFFKNPLPYFKKYPDWFNALTNDEKAAHIMVYTGVIFIILGIVVIIVV